MTYEQGYRPCLDAARTVSRIAVRDVNAEKRWPKFTATAIELAVTGSVSVGMPVSERVLGGLNVYATRSAPFDEHKVQLAGQFAEYAAVVVCNADVYDKSVTLVEQMQLAIAGRAVIEQAKGVLMAQPHCDEADAFRVIAKWAQDTNRKLRDIAAEIVEHATTVRPGAAPGRGQRSYPGPRPTRAERAATSE